MNPYAVVTSFEERLADWCGSKYAVAVESCSAAIFLSLMWRKEQMGKIGEVTIPSRTYPSVPCSIIHAGGKVKFCDDKWNGEYELNPLRIWDAALRLHKGMFTHRHSLMNGMQCLSFHIKKSLKIGRGGMILLDDLDAYEWLKRARFDGRNPIPLMDDNFTQLGYNMYMEPANAARGIQLFEILRDADNKDLDVEAQGYADLSKFEIYKR